MPYLICYDITKNSLRTKMAKKIIEHGLDRINKSVYLGSIPATSLQQLEALLIQALAASSDPDDSLLIIPVHAAQVQEMKIHGKQFLDPDELSGEKTTIIL